MPDFGLTEALANAAKSMKDATFIRAPAAMAEVDPALRGKTTPADAVAQAVARREQTLAPTPGAPPAAAPRVDPDAPQPPPGAPPAPPAPVQTAGAPPTDTGSATDVNAAATETPPAPGAQPTVPAAPSDSAVPTGAIQPGQTATQALDAPVKPADAIAPPAQSPLEAAYRQTAQRFVTANMGDFSESELNLSHMPNVTTMTSPDQMKAAILQVARDNEAAITAARRGTISNEQLMGLAQDLSLDANTTKQVLEREFGTQLESPEIILAARLIEQNNMGQLFAMSDRGLSGQLSSQELIDAVQHMQLVAQYRTQLSGAAAEEGRGLNAFNIPVGLPEASKDHIADIIRKNNPDLQATFAAIKLAASPNGIANISIGNLWKRVGLAGRSVVIRNFVNSILSGPPTWAKILIGNNYNLLQNTADMFAAGLVRGTIGLAGRLGRFPTSAEGAQMSDAFTYAHGVISSGADALRAAGRVVKTGVSLDNILRFDPAEMSGVKNVDPSLGTLQSVLPEIRGTWMGSIAKHLDTVIDAPGSRVIGAVDEFTKTMGARGYRTMLVMREIRAKMLDGTLKPGDEGLIAKQMFENPSNEMLQAEEAWAHRQTFQSPFPEGGPGEAFSNFIANKVPSLKFVFPFMRTSLNIFKQSIGERTPLALLSTRVRAQLAAGGAEADMAMGRIATGTAIGGMMAWMAVHDRITGDAPKDPKERLIWEADGRQPYSIKVTNPLTGESKWHSYAWLEPVASIAGVIADSAYTWSYVHQNEEIDSLKPHGDMLGDAVAHIMGAIITNTANKTFMTGAMKFAEMFADPARQFGPWAQDIGTSMVPYSKGIEFVRNMQDPYLREAYTTLDKINNDLPTPKAGSQFGSRTLGVRTDFFGEPRTSKGGNSILGPLSPFPSSDAKADAVVDELQSIFANTHTVPIGMPDRRVSMPGAGGGKGILGGSGMPLTSQEYSELVQKSRAEPNFDAGKTNLHDKLGWVIQTPTYQASTPAERSAMIQHYVNAADQMGRDRLFKENPDFAQRLMATTAERNRIKFNQ